VAVAIAVTSSNPSQQDLQLLESVSKYFVAISALVGTESGMGAAAVSLPVSVFMLVTDTGNACSNTLYDQQASSIYNIVTSEKIQLVTQCH